MLNKNDKLYEQARFAVIEAGKASASYLQRKLGIGYNKAVSFIDRLEKESIIGESRGAKPRKVYVKPFGGLKNEYLEKGSIEDEELYEKAKNIMRETGKISSSIIMKKFGVGYARSAIIVEKLKARIIK